MIAREYDLPLMKWRALTEFQQLALWELWDQGVHHGNETTRAVLRGKGLMAGEQLSGRGLELVMWAYDGGLVGSMSPRPAELLLDAHKSESPRKPPANPENHPEGAADERDGR